MLDFLEPRNMMHGRHPLLKMLAHRPHQGLPSSTKIKTTTKNWKTSRIRDKAERDSKKNAKKERGGERERERERWIGNKDFRKRERSCVKIK